MAAAQLHFPLLTKLKTDTVPTVVLDEERKIVILRFVIALKKAIVKVAKNVVFIRGRTTLLKV